MRHRTYKYFRMENYSLMSYFRIAKPTPHTDPHLGQYIQSHAYRALLLKNGRLTQKLPVGIGGKSLQRERPSISEAVEACTFLRCFLGTHFVVDLNSKLLGHNISLTLEGLT